MNPMTGRLSVFSWHYSIVFHIYLKHTIFFIIIYVRILKYFCWFWQDSLEYRNDMASKWKDPTLQLFMYSCIPSGSCYIEEKCNFMHCWISSFLLHHWLCWKKRRVMAFWRWFPFRAELLITKNTRITRMNEFFISELNCRENAHQQSEFVSKNWIIAKKKRNRMTMEPHWWQEQTQQKWGGSAIDWVCFHSQIPFHWVQSAKSMGVSLFSRNLIKKLESIYISYIAEINDLFWKWTVSHAHFHHRILRWHESW